MTHLADSVICPHCGEQYNVAEKENKAGDIVRRGVCPSVPVTSTNPPWATPWEMVRRAPRPVGVDEPVMAEYVPPDYPM